MATAVKGSPVGHIDLSKSMKDESKADPKLQKKPSEGSTSITSGGDMEKFAGRIVAFVTGSGYIRGIGAYQLQCAESFGFIPEKRLPVRNQEARYCMYRLLDAEKGVATGCSIDSKNIGQNNFSVRFATKAEIICITQAVNDGHAKFELLLDKQRVASILERSLKLAS